MQSAGKLPDLYPLLARAANLDPYSYEYEMMQAEIITFSLAKGLAAEFISDGSLDIDAFEAAWSENSTIEKLKAIAQQHLSSEDLQQYPSLKNALLEAYNLGKNTKSS